MIETVSQLLNKFKEISLEEIDENDSDITHRPTIGNIFEGLTSEILEKSVFKGLNLRVVRQSFIYNDENKLSDEIDCMLVVGEGEKINFTDQYKYHIDQVIAVIQVKKKLYANDIIDAHENLHSVFKINQPDNLEDGEISLFYDAYRLLNSKPPPKYCELPNYTSREQLSYQTLLSEAKLPVRIVFGYYGYKNEFELRKGFVNKIEKLLEEGPLKNFSPATFPNLLICNDISVIKNNGMPFGIPFKYVPFYWHILTTSTGNPIKDLLELIWTKLSYKYELGAQIFGDDFNTEQAHPFIACRDERIDEESSGWQLYFHELSKEELKLELKSERWKPVEIDVNQQIILTMLGRNEEIDLENDSDFNDFLEDNNINKKEIIGELIDSRLVYVENGSMKLLTDELEILNSPDGRIFAGDNKNGQMVKFLLKQLGKI